MAVEAQVRELIQKNGHIDIATFFETSMSINSNSYYRSRQPIGEEGDFITAPEISQMFGEIVGIWLIDVWQKLKTPKKINLIELGPGRGILMRDILRSTANVVNFHESLNIFLVDINENLKKIQRENLSQFNIPVQWVNNIEDLPSSPTIIIANEFFDALPSHQYFKEKNHWNETVVSIREDNNQLYFKRHPLVQDFVDQLNSDHPNALDGAVLEESKVSIDWMQKISEKIKKNTGAALIIDYGYYINPSDRTSDQYNPTLQGVKNHKYHPILDNIGEVDLSFHVDFYLLKKIADARGVEFTECCTQSELLLKYGIELRLAALKYKNPDFARVLDRQYERLVSEKMMGSLFKALELNHF